MLEWIVHPWHLDEFDFSVEVAVEPKLLERANVAKVPEDGAHEWIVLLVEVLFAHRLDQTERARARLREQARDLHARGSYSRSAFVRIDGDGHRPISGKSRAHAPEHRGNVGTSNS